MSDDASEDSELIARERREGRVVFARVKELHESPIQGSFDIAHLKAIHAWLFQDLPHHQPGVIRGDTHDSWIRLRVLEGHSADYAVHYAHRDVERGLTDILRAFGGARSIRRLSPNAAARRIAKLYRDLDHLHGFHEGNSRTLREFTRELAEAAGFTLDWIGTGVGSIERNQLYMARDVAVLERAFPGLTQERAMTTHDRSEYEASFVLTPLRRAIGERTLEAIMRDAMSRRRS